MMFPWQRSIIASVLACCLCLPGVALAGGWLVMTLDELPTGETSVGQEITLGFVARQHGQQAINGVDAVATFTHRESGQQVKVAAIGKGAVGHYVVVFTPPTTGAWDWQLRAWDADHPMPPLTVAPAAATSSAATQSAPARVQWPLLAGAGALALLGVLGLLAAWRGRVPAPRPA